MNGTVHALQPLQSLHRSGKPERAEVEAAVRTIIRWTGDDPDREGLVETPARLVRALEEFFCGYREDPAGRRCCYQGSASLHDDARRPQARQ